MHYSRLVIMYTNHKFGHCNTQMDVSKTSYHITWAWWSIPWSAPRHVRRKVWALFKGNFKVKIDKNILNFEHRQFEQDLYVWPLDLSKTKQDPSGQLDNVWSQVHLQEGGHIGWCVAEDKTWQCSEFEKGEARWGDVEEKEHSNFPEVSRLFREVECHWATE